MNQPTIPEGMVEVTKEQFFALLGADKRDIMPTTEAPEFTPWRVLATRERWGWTLPGWRSPWNCPRVYAVAQQYAPEVQS
jgi:hypothetical protein